MASGATEWIWEHSRARNGSLIVLLAIADEIGKEGKAEMSVAELARKARSSDRTVQLACRDLAALGELAVDERAGDAGRNVYRMPVADHGRTGEDPAPVKNLHPEESAPLPKISTGPKRAAATTKPQASIRDGAESSPPRGVDNFSDDLDLGSPVSGGKSKSRSSSEPLREDAERLCQHLADRIEANGSKRPVIGKRWRDAARLLIDIDGRTEKQVHDAIDWCQKDEFWHRNILSMPTLREKYDRLRLAALAEQRKKAQPAGRGNPDDEYAAALQRIHARKENSSGTRADGDDRAPRQVSLPAAAN